MRCRIVPAEAWHVTAIAAAARQADVDEVAASSGSTVQLALERGMAASHEPMTAMLDGTPVCMFGAVPWSALGGQAAIWMLGTIEMDRIAVQRDLLRISRRIIDYYQQMYPRCLYNAVDERNTKAIRWLRWLGFKFADPILIGPQCRPFLPFYRFRGA